MFVMWVELVGLAIFFFFVDTALQLWIFTACDTMRLINKTRFLLREKQMLKIDFRVCGFRGELATAAATTIAVLWGIRRVVHSNFN